MAADIDKLMALPRVYSNHPELRCARFSWQQYGWDYLVASELGGQDALRTWAKRVRAGEERHGPMRFMRLVVSAGDFPMGFRRLHEPLCWFRRTTRLDVVPCGEILVKAHSVNGWAIPTRYCDRPLHIHEDVSCIYCGRALCRLCQKKNPSGANGPVCTDCVNAVGAWDLEHLPTWRTK